MWENKIIMRYEIKVSEVSINSRQNMIKDFDELHCCSIREQRLFKHYGNHRQIVKKCFIDSITEFKDWNNNSKFYKKYFFIS